MGEVLFYILDSSFWMWVICIIFACLAIGVYIDEIPIKNNIIKIITVVLLALLAWGVGFCGPRKSYKQLRKRYIKSKCGIKLLWGIFIL